MAESHCVYVPQLSYLLLIFFGTLHSDAYIFCTPHPRPGVAARRSNPMSKEQWLRGCRRAKRSYSTFKVRRGGSEEIPLVQGKEQQLCFAGAAMKRYPTSKVRETQVRW